MLIMAITVPGMTCVCREGGGGGREWSRKYKLNNLPGIVLRLLAVPPRRLCVQTNRPISRQTCLESLI